MNTKLLSLLLIVPMLTFCGPETENDTPEEEQTETPGKEEPGKTEPKPEIKLSGDTSFSFDCSGGTATFTFTANRDWTVTSDSWLKMEPESGSASEQATSVTFTCETNTAFGSRSAYILITAGTAKEVVSVEQAGDPMANAAQELKSGSTVLATNPNVEKFLTSVTYPDRNWSYTEVLNYYGGFNGKTYNENGEEDPNGKMFSWANEPNSDHPMTYSIRWSKEDIVPGSTMTLVLSDKLGWSGKTEILKDYLYVNITNLVPNDDYTYTVTADKDGKVVAQGTFSTTGSLHQVYFQKACRNGRDLGGWKTTDGKTIKYRKVYRGGRMQSETVNSAGKKEIIEEGIGAQLDLRGKSDVLSKPCVEGFEFCGPVIEQGGTSMLKKDAEKTKQCFEFVVNNVRAGKGVYFHCSLGRDRTGTLDILLLGVLGVPEGDIGKAYEVTYFSGIGYSVSSSEKDGNPKPIFKNTRNAWVYSEVVPYFWELADKTEGKTFADGVEKYLLEVAGVSQKDIDDFRALMLE